MGRPEAPADVPAVLPRIKVCGVRAADDVRDALAFGLDAIGLVEHPDSPRAVDATHAARIVAALPAGIAAVAVFVDRSPDAVRRWLATSGASMAQLCGAERPEDWAGFETPLLRRIAVEPGARDELERWRPVAAGFVLDHPSTPGGSGRAVDPDLAAALAARAPCLLAGGLDPDNVAQRVARIAPHGVDASSRLERATGARGTKDPERVTAFVRAARAALAGIAARREGSR